MPGFNIPDETIAEKYVAGLQGEIKEVDQLHPCGWIVDLRGNYGGWYSPMEGGIGPILGEGVLGGAFGADWEIN